MTVLVSAVRMPKLGICTNTEPPPKQTRGHTGMWYMYFTCNNPLRLGADLQEYLIYDGLASL